MESRVQTTIATTTSRERELQRDVAGLAKEIARLKYELATMHQAYAQAMKGWSDETNSNFCVK